MSRPGRNAADARRQFSAGFTLVELLVAIALMAVLAVLGWRGLDTVLDSRERITRASDSLRAMSVAFTQMQEDLRRAWPVRLLNLAVPAVGFVAQPAGRPPALLLVRESLPAGGVPQIQQVVYRLRDDVFERGFARWSAPDSPNGAGAANAAAVRIGEPAIDGQFIWQPLVSGVRGLQFRAFVPGRGWLPEAALVQSAIQQSAGVSSGAVAGVGNATVSIPTGIEAVLEGVGGARIVRLLTVKD